MTKNERQLLRTLLREYRELTSRRSPKSVTIAANSDNLGTSDSALKAFKETSQTKRPHMKDRRETADILRKELSEYHYETAADVLGMVDLTPQVLGDEPDSIRIFLSQFTNSNVNQDSRPVPRDGQGSDAESASSPTDRPLEKLEVRVPGKASRLTGVGRPFAVHVTSTFDTLSRLITAIMAELFLLIPMIALSSINPKGYRLLTTSLFVLALAVVVSMASKAANQELIGATAAYAAV